MDNKKIVFQVVMAPLFWVSLGFTTLLLLATQSMVVSDLNALNQQHTQDWFEGLAQREQKSLLKGVNEQQGLLLQASVQSLVDAFEPLAGLALVEDGVLRAKAGDETQDRMRISLSDQVDLIGYLPQSMSQGRANLLLQDALTSFLMAFVFCYGILFFWMRRQSLSWQEQLKAQSLPIDAISDILEQSNSHDRLRYFFRHFSQSLQLGEQLKGLPEPVRHQLPFAATRYLQQQDQQWLAMVLQLHLQEPQRANDDLHQLLLRVGSLYQATFVAHSHTLLFDLEDEDSLTNAIRATELIAKVAENKGWQIAQLVCPSTVWIQKPSQDSLTLRCYADEIIPLLPLLTLKTGHGALISEAFFNHFQASDRWQFQVWRDYTCIDGTQVELWQLDGLNDVEQGLISKQAELILND